MTYKDSTKTIMTYLNLDRKPVGVKIFFDQEEYDKCPVPERETKVAYCNSVNLA